MNSSSYTAIGPILLNKVKHFAERFRCEVFPNIAGARIEGERLTHLAHERFVFCFTVKHIQFGL